MLRVDQKCILDIAPMEFGFLVSGICASKGEGKGKAGKGGTRRWK